MNQMEGAEARTWSVVKFIGDDSVSVVPTCWIYEDKCYWPPFTTDKVTQAIKTRSLNTCWPLHKISIFRNATYDNYEMARAKSRKAEDTSELNSEDDGVQIKKRKRVANNQFSSSDEDELQENIYVKPAPVLKNNLNGRKALSRSRKDTEASTSNNMNNVEAEDLLLSPTTPNQGILKEYETISITPRRETTNDTPCNCCPHETKYLKEILRVQHLIKARINDLEQSITNQNQISQADDRGESVLKDFDFPLNTIDQFTDFNSFLDTDEVFTKAVAEFSTMGGNNVYEFVKRILSQVMTNELASLYSWLGRRTKNDFSKLQFAKLIIASAEKAKISPNKKKIEESISIWLRRAKDRMTNKTK